MAKKAAVPVQEFVNLNECVTADEIAVLMRSNRSTVMEFAHDGKIPHYRVGKRYWFKPEEVMRAMGLVLATKVSAAAATADTTKEAAETRPRTS